MPTLFSRSYSPDELRRLTGSLQQLAGIRMVEYADGKARGLRAAEVWTGTGLRFSVWLDRALDIGPAEHNGRGLAWLHPALGTPDQYDPHGLGWLRTFGGGLLTTCGLTFFGHPEVDQGEELGLHGRIAHTPAENIHVTQEWREDEYVLELTGQVRQSVIFGENLLLNRCIQTRLGSNSIRLSDTVSNESFRETPNMLLYHCNFGFPVVSPQSELLVVDEEVRGRDEQANRGLGRELQLEPPQPGYAEQVFFHKPRAGRDGLVRAAIVNRVLGFGAYIKYRAKELPYLTQWKMMGAGEYVCALEPTNCWETPRAQLRAEGKLPMLAPGERVEYELELGALPDEEAIASFHEELGTR